MQLGTGGIKTVLSVVGIDSNAITVDNKCDV